MIYLDLFLGFLRVGCFAFGGAYAAIPLIRDVVVSYGWLSDEALAYMIAVSESTPGPIMVNLATYVGSSQGGFFGALLATVAVVLPSFLIILLVTAVFQAFLGNRWLQAVLRCLKPCMVGIILATGITMTLAGLRAPAAAGAPGSALAAGVDVRAVFVTAVLAAVMFGAKPLCKKKISPISLIVFAACLGVVVQGLK